MKKENVKVAVVVILFFTVVAIVSLFLNGVI